MNISSFKYFIICYSYFIQLECLCLCVYAVFLCILDVNCIKVYVLYPMFKSEFMLHRSIVPPKILVFSWRLLQDRLPTCQQLHRRRAYYINLYNNLAGYVNLRWRPTSFFIMFFSFHIWNAVINWLSINFVIPEDINSLYTGSILTFCRPMVK